MDKPTKEEMEEALKTIGGVCVFAALHHYSDKPVPSLVKTLKWLREEYGIEENSQIRSATQ